jgi:Mg-chelatase subunit ChlD
METWTRKIIQKKMKETISPEHDATMKQRQAQRMEKLQNLGSMRNAIREMLSSPTKTGTRRNQIIGRMDRRALVGCSLDKQDVMQRKWREEGKNTVIHLAIDASGSMNNGMNNGMIDQAADFCKIFTDIISQAGCKCTVSLYSTSIYSLCKKNERLKSETIQQRIANIPRNTHGNTDTMLALIDGYNQLKDVVNAKRLLIVMTDGADDVGYSRVRATSKLIADKGVTVLGIGIGGNDVSGQYPYTITIPRYSDMIQGSLNEICKVLRSINQ